MWFESSLNQINEKVHLCLIENIKKSIDLTITYAFTLIENVKRPYNVCEGVGFLGVSHRQHRNLSCL